MLHLFAACLSAAKKPLDHNIAISLYSDMAIDNQLNSVFHALSDPTRRAILARLALGEATVSELMAPFGFSQPTISRHLKVLEGAGLIEGGRDAQRRPRRLTPKALIDASDWIEPFRRQWEQRFANLDTHLARLQKET
jgi:DNA-binding transcriptional ArsR family regulator